MKIQILIFGSHLLPMVASGTPKIGIWIFIQILITSLEFSMQNSHVCYTKKQKLLYKIHFGGTFFGPTTPVLLWNPKICQKNNFLMCPRNLISCILVCDLQKYLWILLYNWKEEINYLNIQFIFFSKMAWL